MSERSDIAERIAVLFRTHGMMRVNRVGALYHLGMAQLNQDGFADGFH